MSSDWINAMKRKTSDIGVLLSSGESELVEFKSSFDREAIETLAAFANSSGGTVLIGVSDTGQIRGISVGKETLNEWLGQIKSSTSPSLIPDIHAVETNRKTVVIISIPPFPVKPVACKGKYFKRIASSNHQMPLSQIADMYLQSLQISWDSYPHEQAGLDDLDIQQIADFIAEVNTNGRFQLDESPLSALEKLRLIRGGQPTHAAMLLFATQPLWYNVRIGRFKNVATIIDDHQITATLFSAVDQTMQVIKSHLSLSYQFDGGVKRIETWEYPLPALREAVLNAVVHRDYSNPSDIQIKIFDDRITIFSPGKLYGDLTVEKIRANNYQSNLRNKLVAEAFYLTRRIEKYGSGFARIYQELRLFSHISFVIEEIANGLLVSFIKTGEVTGEVTREVAGEVMRLLRVCNGDKSRKELQELMALKHEDHFRQSYLLPALESGLLEMTRPDTPKSRLQRYRLTDKGKRCLIKPEQGVGNVI